MADTNRVFGLLRTICMAISIILSALVLIMAALVTNFTLTYYAGYFVYAVFAIAVAGLTLISVPVMLFVSVNRKGAITSMVIVELCWFGLLWILWLAVGGTVASMSWINYCWTLSYSNYYSQGAQGACMETQAMAGFAFLNWLVLLVLNITLLSLAIKQSNRGYSVWTSYVTDADFGAPAANPAMAMDAKGTAYPTAGIPQPQYIPPQAAVYQQPQFIAPQQQQQPQFTGSTQPTQFTTPSPQPQLQQQYMPQAAQV